MGRVFLLSERGPTPPLTGPMGKTFRAKEVVNVKKEKREVISFRKTCKAAGTGLAHYVLMGPKSK